MLNIYFKFVVFVVCSPLMEMYESLKNDCASVFRMPQAEILKCSKTSSLASQNSSIWHRFALLKIQAAVYLVKSNQKYFIHIKYYIGFVFVKVLENVAFSLEAKTASNKV